MENRRIQAPAAPKKSEFSQFYKCTIHYCALGLVKRNHEASSDEEEPRIQASQAEARKKSECSHFYICAVRYCAPGTVNRNHEASSDEDGLPQPPRLSKRRKSDQVAEPEPETRNKSDDELSYVGDDPALDHWQPDYHQDADTHESEPEPEIQMDLIEPNIHQCPLCDETMDSHHAENCSPLLERMLRIFHDSDDNMTSPDRKTLMDDICVRMSREKKHIDEALDEMKPYTSRFDINDIMHFLDPKFVSQVRKYVADPLSAPVWKHIKHKRSRLEANRDVDDRKHLGGGL